jgi:hypothetical protein
MRRSDVNLPPIAVAFKVASLVVIAAGLAWILIDSLMRQEPVSARADPFSQSGKIAIQR